MLFRCTPSLRQHLFHRVQLPSTFRPRTHPRHTKPPGRQCRIMRATQESASSLYHHQTTPSYKSTRWYSCMSPVTPSATRQLQPNAHDHCSILHNMNHLRRIFVFHPNRSNLRHRENKPSSCQLMGSYHYQQPIFHSNILLCVYFRWYCFHIRIMLMDCLESKLHHHYMNMTFDSLHRFRLNLELRRRQLR